MDFTTLADPDSPLVKAALTHKCAICKAAIGEMCCNTIDRGKPLPGRLIHFERLGED